MYLIVIGAGLEGASLIDIAVEKGNEVALIESNEERARAVLNKHNIKVFQADIATGSVLEEADAKRADAIIATTSDDSANLMAMFLGKEYGIETLVSLVNEESHQKMFENMGVQVLTNPENIVAQYLYQFVDSEKNK